MGNIFVTSSGLSPFGSSISGLFASGTTTNIVPPNPLYNSIFGSGLAVTVSPYPNASVGLSGWWGTYLSGLLAISDSPNIGGPPTVGSSAGCSVVITEPGTNGGPSTTYNICCTNPNAQTLFLGCSIQAFTANLGWGGESSRLVVDIVRDNCDYPILFDKNNNPINNNRGNNSFPDNHYTVTRNTRPHPPFSLDKNGNPLVPGKVYYEASNDKIVSKYHFGPDPGFYGDMPPISDSAGNISPNPFTMDIIGTPVYFKYDDFEFYGIVSDWTKNIDASNPINSYKVTIESPAFLLNHAYMILSSYNGSIFTKTNASDTVGFPRYEKGIYAGKIAEQNIPNIFNVFGYLEDTTDINTNTPVWDDNVPQFAFGRSNRTDQGLRVDYILSGLSDLVSSVDPLVKQKILRYSPYGRILGRAIKYKNNGTNVDYIDAKTHKRHIGLIFPFNYGNSDPSYGPEHRMGYSLDLSSLNDGSIPPAYRFQNETSSVMDLLQDITTHIGKEIFITLEISVQNSIIYPIIKVSSISTYGYPRLGAVESFVNYLLNNGYSISAYETGLESNTSQPVRTMLIGGKQQRLYQVRNNKYASKQSSLRYNPYVDKFIEINYAELNNQQIRVPNPTNYRNVSMKYDRATPLGQYSSRVYGDSTFNTPQQFGEPILRGNYYNTVNLNIVGMIPAMKSFGMGAYNESTVYQTPNWIEVSSGDTICPYFGNDLITNTVRRVFSHTTGFIVEFSTAEIGLAIGRPFAQNETVGVSESEIRAAMNGLDNWLSFIQAVVIDAKNLGQDRQDKGNTALQIYSKVIMPLFNIPSVHNPQMVFMGLHRGASQVNNKLNNSQTGSHSVPLAPYASFLSNPNVFDVFYKLWEFFRDIGNEYYGKQYMVSVPSSYFQYWTDATGFTFDNQAPNCDNTIVIGYTDFPGGQPIYMSQGSSKTYYSLEPANEAWEEYFNFVDDLLVVGSPDMFNLTNDNNAIYPILGYNSNKQYNYIKEYHSKMWDLMFLGDYNPHGSPNQNFLMWYYDVCRGAGITFRNPAGNQPIDFWDDTLFIRNEDSVVVSYDKKYYQNSNGNNSCSVSWLQRLSQPATDAFTTPIPQEKKSKTYVKAEVSTDIQPYYSRITGRLIPKIIIKNTQGAYISPLTSDSLHVRTAAVEFLADYFQQFTLPGLASRQILSGNSYWSDLAEINSIDSQLNANARNEAEKQKRNISIHPKAAMPVFAGVPLLFNNAVYGPWVSAPDIIKNQLFADNADRRLENLVGGSKVEINNELVPWNYGGMRSLDEAACILVAADNNYQLMMEKGSITINGLPNKRLGDELKDSNVFAFNGPTINSINVQIGQQSISTTYTFRTFTKKFTLFNKESAQRIKEVSTGFIKSERDSRQKINKVVEMFRNMGSSTLSPASKYDFSGTKLGQYSPSTILVGFSFPFLNPLSSGNNTGFFPNPSYGNDVFSKDMIRQHTSVSLQESREVPQEFDWMYSSKSFMSLEGLLSPVSFYPTFNNSTNPYKKYFTINCPFCYGTKKYTYGPDNIELYCTYCTDQTGDIVDDDEISSPARLTPYIVSSGNDDNIINDPQALKRLVAKSAGKKINYINLNPIIMPVGELRNKYAQDNDYTAHNIDIIGRSIVPNADLSIVADSCIDASWHTGNIPIGNVNGNPPCPTNIADQNHYTSYLDWNLYSFQLSLKEKDNRVPNPQNYFLNNQRFLSLRGPLVLSGWGFDTEGYPVPNSSGEPKELNNRGYPKMISSPTDRDGGFENHSGVILGKNQTWDSTNNKWTDPQKENTFYKGWGQRSDLWPVGPIDLRWDHKRKVWTCVNDQGLFAEVQLEDDLVPPKVARGFLHAVDNKSPLGSGLRRMVFVEDESETYGAPRGAKLFCHYNDSTGFYNPVNRQYIITSGLITGSDTANIYNGYAKGYNKEIGETQPPDSILVKYNNFLNFPISTNNQKGMFIYITNQWLLLSTSCE